MELFEIILYMQDKAQHLFVERDIATGELLVDEGARTRDARTCGLAWQKGVYGLCGYPRVHPIFGRAWSSVVYIRC